MSVPKKAKKAKKGRKATRRVSVSFKVTSMYAVGKTVKKTITVKKWSATQHRTPTRSRGTGLGPGVSDFEESGSK